MANVKCDVSIPKVNGLEDNDLTVGRHFYLNCTGNYDKAFDFTKAQIEMPDKDKLMVKVFKVDARDANSFDVDMTVYAGIEFPDLVLTDTNLKMSLGKQTFKVTSVLPQPDPQKPEPPKPFGFAVGALHWPIAYTLVATALIFLIVVQVLRIAFKRKKWNRLKEVVKSYDSALAPDNQFFKKMREIEKKDYPLSDIIEAVKIYILREFQAPIFDLSIKESIQFIKKRYPRQKELRRLVFNILKDIDLLKNDPEINMEKKIKFINQFYDFMEKCEKIRKSGGLQ